jgi:hypothetical protein
MHPGIIWQGKITVQNKRDATKQFAFSLAEGTPQQEDEYHQVVALLATVRLTARSVTHLTSRAFSDCEEKKQGSKCRRCRRQEGTEKALARSPCRAPSLSALVDLVPNSQNTSVSLWNLAPHETSGTVGAITRRGVTNHSWSRQNSSAIFIM